MSTTDNQNRQINNIPDWMKNSQEYYPQKDRDAFLTKSSKTILKVLSKINFHAKNHYSDSINTQLKLFFTLVCLILNACSHNLLFSIYLCSCLLFYLAFLDGDTIRLILTDTFQITLVSACFLLPSIFLNATQTFITITAKIYCSSLLIMILSHTTSWNKITSSLRFFHLSSLFILTLDLTIKYIQILGDHCNAMLIALRLRSIGRNSSKHSTVSGILGTTYLKSRQFADETYDAMRCRCFDGEYTTQRSMPKFHPLDILLLLFLLLTIFVFFVLT